MGSNMIPSTGGHYNNNIHMGKGSAFYYQYLSSLKVESLITVHGKVHSIL